MQTCEATTATSLNETPAPPSLSEIGDSSPAPNACVAAEGGTREEMVLGPTSAPPAGAGRRRPRVDGVRSAAQLFRRLSANCAHRSRLGHGTWRRRFGNAPRYERKRVMLNAGRGGCLGACRMPSPMIGNSCPARGSCGPGLARLRKTPGVASAKGASGSLAEVRGFEPESTRPAGERLGARLLSRASSFKFNAPK